MSLLTFCFVAPGIRRVHFLTSHPCAGFTSVGTHPEFVFQGVSRATSTSGIAGPSLTSNYEHKYNGEEGVTRDVCVCVCAWVRPVSSLTPEPGWPGFISIPNAVRCKTQGFLDSLTLMLMLAIVLAHSHSPLSKRQPASQHHC